MKIRQHSQQARENVVEKFKAGLSYNGISKALNISKNTIHSIIQKWKNGTTANLPKHDPLPKQTLQTRRPLFRETLKRPVVILEKLPRSTAQERKMDVVGWSSSRSQESFRADTLSRLASFITRTDTKQQNHQPSSLPLYGCQECGKGLPYHKDLLQHQEQKNALPKPHRCSYCGQQFSLRSSLQLHQCNVDLNLCDSCRRPTRRSSTCTTLLSNPDRLQEKPLHHQAHLLDSSPYACAPCGRSFSQKQALLHHQQAGCGGSPSNAADSFSLPGGSLPASALSNSSDIPGPSCRAVLMCQICSRNFCAEAALLQHIQDSHVEEKLSHKRHSDGEEEEGPGEVNGAPNENLKSKQKLLSCRSCDMVFRSTSKLYMHRKEKHSREKPVSRETRPATKKLRKTCSYPCQNCCKVFLHHLSLRAHYRRHAAAGCVPVKNRSNSASCTSKDSKRFKLDPKRRPTDKKTHRGGPGRPRKVPRLLLAVKAPAKVSKMDKEEEQEEERDFPCPSCAEVFSMKQQLKEHMELHQSSLRRRQCSVCTSEMDACKGPGSKRQRLYHCVPCQQGFSALDSFLEHCQGHLRIRVEEDHMSESHTLHGSEA